MTIPAITSMRYRKMRLEGNGAEPGMLGTTNFSSRYITTIKIIGLVNAPMDASSTCLCDGDRHGLFRLDRRRWSLPRHFELGWIHGNRLSAHLLQERDDGQDFILRQTDGVLVDVGHAGRIFLGQPFVSVVQVNVGLRLRQAFENEFTAELGADAF